MACRLISTKPLSEPILPYCQLEPKEHISMKFYLKFKSFHSRKCTGKWRPLCLPQCVNGTGTILVSYLWVKSLKLIWRLSTCRWNLQMCCRNFSTWQGTRASMHWVHWADGHITVRCYEVSKPRNLGLDLTNLSEIDWHLGSSTAKIMARCLSNFRAEWSL